MIRTWTKRKRFLKGKNTKYQGKATIKKSLQNYDHTNGVTIQDKTSNERLSFLGN